MIFNFVRARKAAIAILCMLFSSNVFAAEREYVLVDQILTRNNLRLQAVPYAIAEHLLDACRSEIALIKCPGQRRISAFVSETSLDPVYLEAIAKYTESEAVTKILAMQPQSFDVQNRNSAGLENSTAVNPAYVKFEELVASRVKHYRSEREVMARLIQGLFELNLEFTTGHEFLMTPERAEFLAGFTHQDGRQIFSDGLEKLEIAREMKHRAGRYSFLKDEANWTYNNVNYRWQPRNASLMNVYFNVASLIAGQPRDGNKLARH